MNHCKPKRILFSLGSSPWTLVPRPWTLVPGPSSLVPCLLTLFALSGCNQETPPATTSPVSSIDGSKYLLKQEPEGGTSVIQVREAAKDQDDVVVVGRIGGSEKPWIEGQAAFTIVDESLKSCNECGSEGCPKPWDYC